jgi:hypothetical protein
MELLVRNFNSETVPNLMCTNTVSVGWDGKVYDCDFNQQLSLDLNLLVDQGNKGKAGAGQVADVFSLGSLDELLTVPVATDSHCFGCTAGMGSS